MPGANDNARIGRPRLRRALHEAIVLILLATTLGAVYHLGRLHGFQRVISIPDPQGPGLRVG